MGVYFDNDIYRGFDFLRCRCWLVNPITLLVNYRRLLDCFVLYSHTCVGNVRAIPSHQEVNPRRGRDGNVQRVRQGGGRYRAAGNESVRQRPGLLRDDQRRDALNRRQSLSGGNRISPPRLGDHQRRHHSLIGTA